MDIPRTPPNKKRQRALIAIGGVAAIVVVTVALSRLKPAAPSVDRATVVIDTVKQGAMVRDVRGPGTLAPESPRFISAVTSGRVDRVVLRPGAKVEPNTVLLEMSNPDVELSLLGADVVIVSAVSAASVDSRLLARPAGPGELYLAGSSGSEVFRVRAGGSRLVSRRRATRREVAALDQIAERTVRRLAGAGLETRLEPPGGLNRRISLAPESGWPGSPRWPGAPLAEPAIPEARSSGLHGDGVASLAAVLFVAVQVGCLTAVAWSVRWVRR